MTVPTEGAAQAIANADAIVNPPADPEQPASTEQPQATAEPPAWQSVLEVLPESLHQVARPVLEEYDQTVTSRYTELEQQYEPWKDVTQYDPEEVQKAINFALSFNEDPVSVFERIRDHLIETGQLEEEPDEVPPSSPPSPAPPSAPDDTGDDDDPVYAKLKAHFDAQFAQFNEILGKVAETENTRAAKEQESQELEALNQHLQELADKHGDLDREFMLAKLARGIDGDTAARQWIATVEAAAGKAVAPAADAPPVLGGGGGSLPSNQVSPGSLSSSDRKALVEQYLQRAASES